ncbi:class I SAM-dependent methyltransferase [Arenimonas daejeonensis]|uniref:class I SAM-dependent methyltransferase n=1 Tax=Arenimonas daejeonensis TaxID=370777 RepID=UPI001D1424FC|nr:methyltransferase domain-containing protein [Arenimonas daejeonensis]
MGGNTKAIALPPQYADFEHLLLDIDPSGSPDILCDARLLTTLEPRQFDAIYCSHNLEHYYAHDVPRVLAGFQHVLKPGGFAQIRVPDMHAVMKMALEKGLDIEDTLYTSPSGPISVLDVFYGYGAEIERSGNEYYAHKTGFTNKSLQKAVQKAGFTRTFSGLGNLEVNMLAFNGEPDAETRRLFGLPA